MAPPHAFIPSTRNPAHCAVCWQYEPWWQHNASAIAKEQAAAEKVQQTYCQERYAGQLPAQVDRDELDDYLADED
jgi:hypothetical protein